eukprot:GHVU01097827.1.p1 GENE.GHVU01097827.1~~GHVU01097827.1.p1  ORF type:complete len:534 (+),score=89.07 GHVU01097827.1:973-2574(+)
MRPHWLAGDDVEGVPVPGVLPQANESPVLHTGCLLESSFVVASNQQATPSTGPTGSPYDYDLLIVGCGVGGHGAAIHAVSKGLKTAVLTGEDVGGTCVNRGCIPSKALLAAANKVRELTDKSKLAKFGVRAKDVTYNREEMASHAKNLVNNLRKNLEHSLKSLNVDLIPAKGILEGPNAVRVGNNIIRAKDIILATGSTPYVPPGVEVDESTVFTSDSGVNLDFIPPYLAIVGSGYIGLEFSDIYTALGSEVTFLEAGSKLLPSFDPDVAKMADRLLIKPRPIDARLGVVAASVKPGVLGKTPVRIQLVDRATKQPVEELFVDACLVATGRRPLSQNLGLEQRFKVKLSERGFVPVDDRMRVVSEAGIVPHLYCIGDANGRMMLAHAASAQGAVAVENIIGKERRFRAEAVPAACFTHPEISFVGLSEADAQKKAKEEGFELGKTTSSFRANSRALAELEGEGLCKILYNKNSRQLLGAHMIGMHASDLIQEIAAAIHAGTTIDELSFVVHAHPTLSEVVDQAFKGAVGIPAH